MNFKFIRTCLVPLWMTASMHAQVGLSQDNAVKEFDGFPAARSEVLSLIGGSTKQIRIITDFLSDGEIVSALYIAQYRKVDVKVLLGPAKASHVLSRLGYLRSQNIPVWLRPKGFYQSSPTIILADDNLFSLNAELDYMARHRRFTISKISSESSDQFIALFDQAAMSGVVPEAKPLPLVGRAKGGAYRSPQPSTLRSSQTTRYSSNTQPTAQDPQQNQNAPDTYRYSHRKDAPGTGIPTKLPKTTILQNRSVEE